MSDLREFREDGFSADRRRDFAAAKESVLAWERNHPLGFEDYLRFLDSFQEVFGDLTQTFDGSITGDLRL